MEEKITFNPLNKKPVMIPRKFRTIKEKIIKNREAHLYFFAQIESCFIRVISGSINVKKLISYLLKSGAFA